jgi:hypothetical protein
MGFRRSDLQEAFFVPGVVPISRAWLLGPTTEAGPERRGGYGTTDPLEEVLAREYLRAAGWLMLMHPGDLIYVSMPPRRERADGPELGELCMALVMVRAGEQHLKGMLRAWLFGQLSMPNELSSEAPK